MKLSEVPIETVAIGDKVVSAVGNQGTIIGIYPHGKPSPFRGCVRTEHMTPEIIIAWYGSRAWSIAEHAKMDNVEYDGVATTLHRARVTLEAA